MRIAYTEAALAAVADAPQGVKKAFSKQMLLLEQNLLHPSLHAKKYSQAEDKWQGRVNRDWRFYFRIIEGTIVITEVIPHPK